jgi:TatD DNase family protein
MSFIDTHSHLYLEEFNSDIEQVVHRAKDAGLSNILLPNIDKDSLQPLNSLCEKYPGFFLPMIGLHPTSVKEDYKEELQIVDDEVKKGKYIAIGEIGIDLYWDKTYKIQQIHAFEHQIELALKYKLPIVVHARESFDEIFDVLKNYKNKGLTGVMHSFTGTEDDAKKALDMGFYIGVGGISTFKNSEVGRIIAAQPLDKLLLETDSPYLAPTPKRGKRNESSYIVHIAEHLANSKGVDVDEIATITTKNAKELFKI